MIRYNEYYRMIGYLMEQDLQHLEDKRMGWRIGDQCKKCGKGTLQMTGKKEDTETRMIETFRCDYCGSEFANQRVESHDTIILDDRSSHIHKNNEALLGTFSEDALNYSINEYIRKIKNDFRQYDLNKIVGSELDVILGMVINEIFNRFLDSASKNSIEITEKENRFFYQNIGMANLRNNVRHMLEV